MNDEIKEILNRINNYQEKLYCLSEKEKRILLDYITNLQQKINVLETEKEQLNSLVNSCQNKIREDNLLIDYQDMEQRYNDYKSRCEKGIEYIEDNTYYKSHKGYVDLNDLLNILQNGSDSQ